MKIFKPVLAALAVLAVMSVISCEHPAADTPEPAKPVYSEITEQDEDGVTTFKVVSWELPEGVSVKTTKLTLPDWLLEEADPDDPVPTELLALLEYNDEATLESYTALFEEYLPEAFIEELLSHEDFEGMTEADLTPELLNEFSKPLPWQYAAGYLVGTGAYMDNNTFYGIVNQIYVTDESTWDSLEMYESAIEWEFTDGTKITTLFTEFAVM